MKMWIANILHKWLREAQQEESKRSVATPIRENNAHSFPQQPHARFGMLHVMNGKVLEVCTYKPNPHGSDWTTTYWILNEEQPLAEQLSVVMKLKGLEK